MFPRARVFYLRTPVELSPHVANPRLLVLFSLCLFLAFPANADQYAYQERGDRREGIRSRPVSGDDIELISVRAAPVGGTADPMPERMRLAFYLPEDASVHVTVRELDYRYYYWLDQVRPPHSWQPGRTNSFHWSTRDVLQWLYGRGLQLAELGAIVRLAGTGTPSAREWVAPAVLATDDALVAVESYLFTFKTNFPARLTCTLYPGGPEAEIWSKTFKRVRAGRPFTCRVPLDAVSSGNYRLVVDGYSLETNAPVWQEVRFHHFPYLQ